MLSAEAAKRVPSCAPGGAHLKIAQDRLATAEAAGDEDRHVADMRQDLLRQHGERHRADMPAGLGALDHQRIDARFHEALGQHQSGREGDELGAAILDRAHRRRRRNAARQHDMPDLGAQADLHQLVELRDAW